eukprot:Em0004g36a
MSQAVQATLYILHQTGPTGFLLKEEGSPKKLKVCLGNTHECSCPAFIKEKELCLHILWILLKKFRVSRDNEVAFQLGLVERDIDDVIYGHLISQTSGQSEGNKEPESGAQTQRAVLEGDVCPICQEALLGPSPLAYCKFGCGNSVHLKCIRVYAGHLKITGDVPCPLCRNNFDSLKELSSQRRSAKKLGVDVKGARSVHPGVTCTSCGACCEEVTGHRGHSMEFRQHPDQPWRQARLAQPQVPASIPPDLISNLHSRSITEEDYDLLLQLDTPPGGGTHLVPERALCSLPVKPLDSDSTLILNRAQCTLCNRVYTRGEWIKTLPCKHEFHRDCLDVWIRSGHPACPTDGKPVIGKRKNKPQSKEHVQPSGPNTMLTGWNTGNELMFTVSGRGLEAARQLPVAQVCVQVASRSHAGTIPLASLCPDGVVGEGEATLSTIGTSCIRDGEQDRLPRLHGVGRGRLTSCSTISSPKASDNHKRWSRRELLESRRRLLEQRHHHQSAEACILGKTRMQGEELPQCCGHSICRNPSPPPAICWNPGPPPAICRNPRPPSCYLSEPSNSTHTPAWLEAKEAHQSQGEAVYS